MKADLKGTPVLVTGAGGFIGSHLVETLVHRGARTRALVRYTSRAEIGALTELSAETLANVEVVFGDLRSRDSVRAAVEGTSVVFHLGALISIPYSYQSPDEVVATNISGTMNVLHAVREFRVRRLVHTSTSEVYGTAKYVPMDESHPFQGQSPYSASKIGADKLVESFARSFGVPAVTVRPFNTFGPRQSTRAVIPTIITQLLDSPVLRLGRLHPRRDFTYVTDTVDGFLRAAVTPGVEGEEINLGTGRDISVAELVSIVGGLMGVTAAPATDSSRVRPEDSEVDRLCAANEKARRLLNWTPAMTLEQGLQKTIDWIGTHRQFYTMEASHR
jgi:NAD dependent epimerase/dehydratase